MSSRNLEKFEADFLSAVRARLFHGRLNYGDKSFDKPGTPDEILEEIVDIAGWAYVLWVQMRERLQRLEQAAQDLESQPDHPRNLTSR